MHVRDFAAAHDSWIAALPRTMTPVGTASRLMSLRALASSDEELCRNSRCAFDAALDMLRRRSRQQRNLHHSVHALLSKAGVTLRTPCGLCTCPDPAVPPAALRRFLSMYAALITELRARPRVFAEIIHLGGGQAGPAAQLLLSFIFGHLWQPADDAALLEVAGRLLRLRARDAGLPPLLNAGALPERLLSGYLRIMPGGASWLQASIGAHIQHVVNESECISAGTLSSAAICARCEALLVDVLRLIAAAPLGLRRLALALYDAASHGTGGATGGGANEHAGVNSGDDMKVMLGGANGNDAGLLERSQRDALLRKHEQSAAAALAVDPIGTGSGAAGGAALVRELLLGLLLSPAVSCPEAYGVLLRSPVTTCARCSLLAMGEKLHLLALGLYEPMVNGERLGQLIESCAERLCSGAAQGCADDEDAFNGEGDGGVAAAEGAQHLQLPALPVEISLGQLRRLHGWCAAHRAPLLDDPTVEMRRGGDGVDCASGDGKADALLDRGQRAQLLEALTPAIRVLSEAGIVWGDESIALDVGPVATIDFVRREKDCTSDRSRPGHGGRGAARSRDSAGSDGNGEVVADSGAAEKAAGLQPKLGRLLQRISLRVLAPPRDDDSEGDKDDDDVEADWRWLPGCLAREALEAAGGANDSLHAGLHGCIQDIGDLRMISLGGERLGPTECAGAVDSQGPPAMRAGGKSRVNSGDWPLLLRRGIAAEEMSLARKGTRSRAEWQQYALNLEAAVAQADVLERSLRRLRRCYRQVQLLSSFPASLGAATSAAVGDVLNVPAAAHGGTAVEPRRDAAQKLAVAGVDGAAEIILRLEAEPWWCTLDEREACQLLCATGSWLRPAPARPRCSTLARRDLARGDDVTHLQANGGSRPATVHAVHCDDGTPYYTVVVDGQERSTERSHLLSHAQEWHAWRAHLNALPDCGVSLLRVPARHVERVRAAAYAAREVVGLAVASPRPQHSAAMLLELYQLVGAVLGGGNGSGGVGGGIGGGEGWREACAWLLLQATAHGLQVLVDCLGHASNAAAPAVALEELPHSTVQSGALGPEGNKGKDIQAGVTTAEAVAQVVGSLQFAVATLLSDHAAIAAAVAATMEAGHEAAIMEVGRGNNDDDGTSPYGVDACAGAKLCMAATSASSVALRLDFDGSSTPLIGKLVAQGGWLQAVAALQARWHTEELERKAVGVTLAQLRAKCVRLYLHEVLGWMQAESLHRVGTTGSDGTGVESPASGLASTALLGACEECTMQHPAHGAYAATLAALRAQPHVVACGLRRSGLMRPRCSEAVQGGAVQMLLVSIYGSRWHAADENAFLQLAEVLCHSHVHLPWRVDDDADADAAEPPDFSAKLCKTAEPTLATKCFLVRVLTAYLRVMPGGAAWLQAAIGSQVQRVVEESEHGLCLMADEMDVYLSLPAPLKAEVDRDVESGQVAALGDHVHLIEVLSARGAALCDSCTLLLESIRRAAGSAPPGLCRIARALHATAMAAATQGSGYAGVAGCEGSGVPEQERLVVELVFFCHVLPALTHPETYGVGREQLIDTAPSTRARANLFALAIGLEQLLARRTAASRAGSRFFTPQLIALAPVIATDVAAELCSAHPKKPVTTATLSVQCVVLETGCLASVLAWVDRHLALELPMPPELAALIRLPAAEQLCNASFGGEPAITWLSKPVEASASLGGWRRRDDAVVRKAGIATAGAEPPTVQSTAVAALRRLATTGHHAAADSATAGSPSTLGFGDVSPLRALEQQLNGSRKPQVQVWVFVLPNASRPAVVGGAGVESWAEVEEDETAAELLTEQAIHAVACSTAAARRYLGGIAATLCEFNASRGPLPRAELSLALAWSVAALRAAALSEHEWLLASHASLVLDRLASEACCRRGEFGDVGGGSRCDGDAGTSEVQWRSVVATLGQLTARRSRLSLLRARRRQLLLYLAECERATQTLSTQSKAALRAVYGLAFELIFDELSHSSSCDVAGAVWSSAAWRQFNAPLKPYLLFQDLAHQPPANRARRCYCHPPSTVQCCGCVDLKLHLEAVVHELGALARKRQTRASSTWCAELERATAAYCNVCDGDAPSLMFDLTRGAAHAAALAHSSMSSTSPAVWADAVRVQDSQLIEHALHVGAAAAQLAHGGSDSLFKTTPSMLARPHSSGIWLLAGLRSAPTPQGRLRAVLRAWNAVLGVVALTNNSLSADDFLPAMASVLLRAALPRLASDLASVANFAWREDFEDMWLFHAVAAAGLMARLESTDSADDDDERCSTDDANGDTYVAWQDVSHLEPPTDAAEVQTAASPNASRGESARLNRSNFARKVAGQMAGHAAQKLGVQFLHSRCRSGSTPTASTANTAPHTQTATPPSVSGGGQASVRDGAASLIDMGFTPEHAQLGSSLFGGDASLAVGFLGQLQPLLEMGFERQRATHALLKSKGADGALQLLLARSSSSTPPKAADAPPPVAASPLAIAEIRALQQRKQQLLSAVDGYMYVAAASDEDTAHYRAALVEFKELDEQLKRAQANSCPAALKTPPQAAASSVSSKAAAASNSSQELSQAADPPAVASSARNIYRASCPRCDKACRFTAPSPAARASPPTKLTVKCPHCGRLFAIQVS